MEPEPREMTTNECRERFLGHVAATVRYWDHEPVTCREKLEGLAFSILVAIDGDASLPAWILAPFPHEEDKAFNQSEGENWYPENSTDAVTADISGGLHEQIHRYFNPRT